MDLAGYIPLFFQIKSLKVQNEKSQVSLEILHSNKSLHSVSRFCNSKSYKKQKKITSLEANIIKQKVSHETNSSTTNISLNLLILEKFVKALE